MKHTAYVLWHKPSKTYLRLLVRGSLDSEYAAELWPGETNPLLAWTTGSLAFAERVRASGIKWYDGDLVSPAHRYYPEDTEIIEIATEVE